jgi:hypothetical protein
MKALGKAPYVNGVSRADLLAHPGLHDLRGRLLEAHV